MSAEPVPMPEPQPEFSATLRLRKDLKLAAAKLGDDEARFIVDTYYTFQKIRVRSGNQYDALEAGGEPHTIIEWLIVNAKALERDIKNALERYAAARVAGEWAMSIVGIKGVIAAGLLANIDIERARTVGAIWRFAGLDPSVKWMAGEKRPWNATLKRLCWIIGESFTKFSAKEKDVYGKIWMRRKELETARNYEGKFSPQAVETLATRKIKAKDTLKWLKGDIDPRVARWWVSQGYSVSRTPTIDEITKGVPPRGDAVAEEKNKDGVVVTEAVSMEEAFAKMFPFTATIAPLAGVQMLSPGHIHARSKRYAVKRFLADFHLVCYWDKYRVLPPKPYVISALGHAHYLQPPNIEMVPGLKEAWRALG
jgi:Transposase IS116/IS110/IS902 family